jgi:hypothetical protein
MTSHPDVASSPRASRTPKPAADALAESVGVKLAALDWQRSGAGTAASRSPSWPTRPSPAAGF